MKYFFIVLLLSVSLYSWEGYSYEKGSYVDVETYNHQGKGEGPIEYYDYNSGEYKSGYLDMYPGGTGTITDDETGETFEVEMEN